MKNNANATGDDRKSAELDRVNEASTRESSMIIAKANYEKPALTCYGDVRDITLGPTAGLGESGNALMFRA
ncbi:MAG: lasso RiPP family leader peptide-containing protein [Gammaproteobacteria bacterium]|nr:lasso RiPP family leader peptide-containing protein [Gammaproteobacteria bacterium]